MGSQQFHMQTAQAASKLHVWQHASCCVLLLLGHIPASIASNNPATMTFIMQRFVVPTEEKNPL
jgi:hypothetical protein